MFHRVKGQLRPLYLGAIVGQASKKVITNVPRFTLPLSSGDRKARCTWVASAAVFQPRSPHVVKSWREIDRGDLEGSRED